MYPYERGDTVHIKSYKRLVHEYGKDRIDDIKHPIGFNDDMALYCDTEQVIARVIRTEIYEDQGYYYIFRLMGDRYEWTWTNDMFQHDYDKSHIIDVTDRVCEVLRG